jgi:hypothetical protein
MRIQINFEDVDREFTTAEAVEWVTNALTERNRSTKLQAFDVRVNRAISLLIFADKTDILVNVHNVDDDNLEFLTGLVSVHGQSIIYLELMIDLIGKTLDLTGVSGRCKFNHMTTKCSGTIKFDRLRTIKVGCTNTNTTFFVGTHVDVVSMTIEGGDPVRMLRDVAGADRLKIEGSHIGMANLVGDARFNDVEIRPSTFRAIQPPHSFVVDAALGSSHDGTTRFIWRDRVGFVTLPQRIAIIRMLRVFTDHLIVENNDVMTIERHDGVRTVRIGVSNYVVMRRLLFANDWHQSLDGSTWVRLKSVTFRETIPLTYEMRSERPVITSFEFRNAPLVRSVAFENEFRVHLTSAQTPIALPAALEVVDFDSETYDGNLASSMALNRPRLVIRRAGVPVELYTPDRALATMLSSPATRKGFGGLVTKEIAEYLFDPGVAIDPNWILNEERVDPGMFAEPD